MRAEAQAPDGIGSPLLSSSQPHDNLYSQRSWIQNGESPIGFSS